MKWWTIFIFALLIKNVLTDEVAEDVADDVEEEPETKQTPEITVVLSEEEEQQLSKKRAETQVEGYQTDVKMLMKTIVNHLYQNKDVFLRELISNAVDALEKTRFWALENKESFHENSDLSVRIKIDPVNHKIEITDTGIGMTNEELSANLGTIAKSGTKEFMNKLISDKTPKGDMAQQIGQFGVGFYSSFLVSDRVIVISRSANSSKQYVFEADMSGFSVFEDPRGVTMSRGTSIILCLNSDSHEFLKEERIADLIRKYSHFMTYPIYIWSTSDESGKEVPAHWKHINNAQPIWTRPPSNITEEEYQAFYNLITYGTKTEKYAKPSGTIHFSAQGSIEFTALVFLPDRLPEDYANSPMNWKGMIRLYAGRVLVTDDPSNILPFYISFIPGVVDSDDFQLNIGRDVLQHKELLKIIRKKISRKVLDYLKKVAQDDPERYNTLYDKFGSALKVGILEDDGNSNRIAKLLRFYSSVSKKNYTSLDEYISRMKSDQRGIFFLSAPSVNEAEKSPYLEMFKFKNYEILYPTSPMDEPVLQTLRMYDNMPITNVAKEMQDQSLSNLDSNVLKEKEEEMKPLLKWLKKSYLKSRVASVRVTDRLLKSSCILVASEQGYSGRMDRLIRAQSNLQGASSGQETVLDRPKNLELNPNHPLVKDMLQLVTENPDSEELKEDAEICFSIASLSGGYSVDDGLQLSGILERLYLKRQDLTPEQVSQKIHEDLGIDDKEEQDEKHEAEHDNEEEDYSEQNDSDDDREGFEEEL